MARYCQDCGNPMNGHKCSDSKCGWISVLEKTGSRQCKIINCIKMGMYPVEGQLVCEMHWQEILQYNPSYKYWADQLVDDDLDKIRNSDG